MKLSSTPERFYCLSCRIHQQKLQSESVLGRQLLSSGQSSNVDNKPVTVFFRSISCDLAFKPRLLGLLRPAENTAVPLISLPNLVDHHSAALCAAQ